MKKAILIIFRILIPLLCAASAAAFFLPSIVLDFAKEDSESIEKYVDDYRDAEESKKASYEMGGKSDVMISIEDSRISVADVIVIHSKTDGNEQIENASQSVDIIYNGITTTVNDNYVLIFILIAVSVIFLLGSMIFSAIGGNKYFSIFAMIFCGVFMAVNGALAAIIQTVLIPALDEKDRIGASASPMLYALVAAAALAMVLAILRMIVERLPDRKKVNVAVSSGDMEQTLAVNPRTYLNQSTVRAYQPLAPQPEVKPVITCLAGTCQGMDVPIENNETIIIGREASVCNIIAKNAKVSRQHCSVSYDRKRNSYIVTDMSHNGTFLDNGTRLLKDHPNLLPAGSVIYLMDRENMFRLGEKS